MLFTLRLKKNHFNFLSNVMLLLKIKRKQKVIFFAYAKFPITFILYLMLLEININNKISFCLIFSKGKKRKISSFSKKAT